MDDFNSPGSIARCVAKSEIESVLHRYALRAKEDASPEGMAPLFKKDGAFRLPNGLAVKPAEFLEVVRGNNPEFIRHHITSIDIDFTSPTEARAESYFFAATHKSPLDHYGRWRDIVVKDSDGRWIIADKTIIVEGADAKGWYKASYPDPHYNTYQIGP